MYVYFIPSPPLLLLTCFDHQQPTEDYDHEPILVNNFNIYPVSISVSPFSSTPTDLQVLVGFEAGHVLRLNPFGAKSIPDLCFNNRGHLNMSRATAICWVPDKSLTDFITPNRAHCKFVVGHENGYLIEYSTQFLEESKISFASGSNAYDPDEEMIPVWFQEETDCNPLAVFQLSPSTSEITAMEFSPDGGFLAVAHADGTLIVIEYAFSRKVLRFHTLFGAVETIAWSSDSAAIVCGGRDDHVYVIDFTKRRLVAECVGHASWVRGVCFLNNPDPNGYVFSSCGEDGQIAIWTIGAELFDKTTRTHSKLTIIDANSAARVVTLYPQNIARAHDQVITCMASSSTWLTKCQATGTTFFEEGAVDELQQPPLDGEEEEKSAPMPSSDDFIASADVNGRLKVWSYAKTNVKETWEPLPYPASGSKPKPKPASSPTRKQRLPDV